MKALLIKKWGGNYAGQVLTGVERGSIPASVAKFYEDDEPTPMDVVIDHSATAEDPLLVVNDEMNPKGAESVHADKKAIVQRAKKAAETGSVAEAAAELDREAGQRRAKEADDFAAKRTRATGSGKALTAGQKKKSQAGKEHGVK